MGSWKHDNVLDSTALPQCGLAEMILLFLLVLGLCNDQKTAPWKGEVGYSQRSTTVNVNVNVNGA